MKKDDFQAGDKFIFLYIGTKKDSTWIITRTNDDYIFYRYYSGEAEYFDKSREFASSWIDFLNNSAKEVTLIKGKTGKLRVAIDKIRSNL